MTNIVERLRIPSYAKPLKDLCNEAADEIERLRELLRDILEAEDLPAHWWLRIREALREKP